MVWDVVLLLLCCCRRKLHFSSALLSLLLHMVLSSSIFYSFCFQETVRTKHYCKKLCSHFPGLLHNNAVPIKSQLGDETGQTCLSCLLLPPPLTVLFSLAHSYHTYSKHYFILLQARLSYFPFEDVFYSYRFAVSVPIHSLARYVFVFLSPV